MRQKNTQTDSFDESSLLMIPAEFADRVDDVVHLSQRHSVHPQVELIEVRTDLLVVIGIVFRQLLSRGKITFYSLIFMEWAMNCKVCVLWALW